MLIQQDKIIIRGAKQNNLKNVSIDIPHDSVVVVTGLSGSGKSSLVIDTIYSEGYRRYVESLSSYARQFLEKISKPNVETISGLRPSIAIEQKSISKNSRSTVGTTTEIYDYYRLLFARIGRTYCFECGNEVKKDTTLTVQNWLKNQAEKTKFYLCFPVIIHTDKNLYEEVDYLKRRGFFRLFYDGKLYDLNKDNVDLSSNKSAYIVFERFSLNKDKIEKLSDSIENAFNEGEGRLAIIDANTNIRNKFNKFYECCGIKYTEPEPRFFSFNSPFGACPVCEGYGKTIGIDMGAVVPNQELSLFENAIAPFASMKFAHIKRDLIQSAKIQNIPVHIPFSELTEKQVDMLIKGFGTYIGIDKFFKEIEKKTYKIYYRVLLSKYRGFTTCNACKGSRLRREALQIKINNLNIQDLVCLSLEKNLQFFNNLNLNEFERSVSNRVLKEILKRLTFLNDIGLGYLTLDRISNTLSGGETQRINLATSIGSALTGSIYILDEPSIGLHPSDNLKLIDLLKKLRDIGNSVLVIEHDPDMIQHADFIIDMGPKAGLGGGEIVASGTISEILKNDNSLTGKYLSGKLKIPVPSKRNIKDCGEIKIYGASENNLKNINVDLPLGKFVVISGVSGSGKSTLVHDVIYGNIAKHFRKNPSKIGKCKKITGLNLIDDIDIVDQSAIGKSSRSNPISYIGAFDYIRELFSMTPQARSRGYKPGFFSFNIPGGRCETCQGDGFVKVEMQFLADIYIECEDCKGTRYKREAREVIYKDKNIVDVLNFSVEEAKDFFSDNKKILNYLNVLSDVGLGYIKLGQPANTLSGGEAQRLKLASKILEANKSKNMLLILDEPTTGLHFEDIKKLLNCFKILLDKGNSLLVIEHNLDIIKCADYVIDLGPKAGEKGGEITAFGTPEDIINDVNSITGQFLKSYL